MQFFYFLRVQKFQKKGRNQKNFLKGPILIELLNTPTRDASILLYEIYLGPLGDLTKEIVKIQFILKINSMKFFNDYNDKWYTIGITVGIFAGITIGWLLFGI